MQNIAAPERASVLMCVKCQSLASPLTAEYWHIGATMMRLASFRPRSSIGENRALMENPDAGRSLSSGVIYSHNNPCSILLDARGLDHLHVGGGVPFHEIVDVGRRHRKRIDSKLLQTLLHRWLGQHLHASVMKLVDDVPRGLCRHEDAIPDRAISIFQA